MTLRLRLPDIPRASISFPMAALLALALLVISEFAYNRSMSAMDEMQKVVEARRQVQTLLRRVLDAESGQRGFLLTGRPEYLHPAEAAIKLIPGGLASLNQYYVSTNPMTVQFTELTQQVANKLSEIALTLQLQREGRTEGWRTLMETNIGRDQMVTIRSIAERLVSDESSRIVSLEQQIQQTLLLSRLGIAAMTPLSLLAFFMYLRQTASLSKEREFQQAALQAERDSLERQVLQRTQQLTALANHLQTAREDERARLARELHDELGALLTAAKLDVARLRSRLPDLSEDAKERITHLNESLNSGIALKRRIIEDLRPSALSNLGLVASLEILTRDFAERAGVEVRGVFEKPSLSPASELTVYRLVQEALTNVAKYAQATEIDVILRALPGHAEITVRDNGIGFDTLKTRPSTHGLVGMRYRVEAQDGRMTMISAPGAGTTIKASVPCLQPSDKPAEAVI
jgi:signal transduction histidine kinase